MSYQPIENYGVIGDLHTVALVGMDGSIDFLCAPRFDSASVFAALLDDERGGRFQLAPLLEGARQKQLNLPDTCVLLTRFLSEEGVAEVSDFMPIGDGRQAHDVVRRAKTVRGEVRFRMVCQPRFDYARAPHTEQTVDGVRFIAGSGSALAFLLRSSISVRIVDGAAVAEFTRGRVGVLRLRAGGAGWGVAVRRPRLRHPGVQGHGQLLARLGGSLDLPRPVAGDGESLRPDAEAPNLAALRVDRRRSHLRPAGVDRRRTEPVTYPASVRHSVSGLT
jgi:hypothetical protein